MTERARPEDDPRTSLGSAPASESPAEDAEEFRERCQNDRESLSPRETADCVGNEIAELYENEEDGGS
jgi:hypothetical protein